MLQQTTTARVERYYPRFLKRFPTIVSLSRAPLFAVLAAWRGLGYNRRAKYLHTLARHVVKKWKGKLPREAHELEALPGVGHYTAAAVAVFAYNRFAPVLDTNIRTVYLHHFFTTHKSVSDKDILQLIEKTADKKNPRRWFSALMDYGAYLKGNGVRLNDRSAHYVRQSAFKGSLREARGKILRALTTSHTARELSEVAGKHTKTALVALLRDGLIEKHGSRYRLHR